MATSYPGALDDFADPTPTSRQNAPSHAGQHKNVNDAIEAVEAELGTHPSGTESTVKARLDKIEDGTRLANDSITSAKIAANAVGSSELADNAVDTAAIQDNAVTSEKIAADAVGSSEIAANAVGSSELADNAVDTAAIADGAVTPDKILDRTVLRHLLNPLEAGERILRGAVWWIDAAHSSASSQAVTNLGWGGSALGVQAGSSSGADSNDPLFLDWIGENYVYLPGAADNYLSVPDQSAFDITGDLDIRVQVALDDWTPSASQALLAKRATTGQTSYSLRVFTGGALELAWSPDGSTGAIIAKSSTANPTVTDGEALWVRATLDVDNGASGNDVKFYTSPDGATWTQLGSTVITAGTASVFASTSSIQIGARAGGGSDVMSGKVHRAVIRDSIGGSPVLDIDTALIASGSAASFTARTGQTVTINRGTSGRKAVAVVHPVWLFGTDDYLETGDFAMLDFDAVTSLSLLVVARQWGTPSSGVDLLAKTAGGGAAGYLLENGVGLPVRGIVTDGTDAAQTANITPTGGVLNVLSAVVDRSGDVLTVTSNGTAQTASTTDVGSLSNSAPLRVCINNDAEIIAAAVFRRALTSDEVTALESYFTGRAA